MATRLFLRLSWRLVTFAQPFGHPVCCCGILFANCSGGAIIRHEKRSSASVTGEAAPRQDKPPFASPVRCCTAIMQRNCPERLSPTLGLRSMYSTVSIRFRSAAMVGIEDTLLCLPLSPFHRDGKDRCKRVHLKFAAHKSTSGETDSVRLGDNATLTSPIDIHADSLLFVRNLSTATDVKT
jgi:hypothetical protein